MAKQRILPASPARTLPAPAHPPAASGATAAFDFFCSGLCVMQGVGSISPAKSRTSRAGLGAGIAVGWVGVSEWGCTEREKLAVERVLLGEPVGALWVYFPTTHMWVLQDTRRGSPAPGIPAGQASWPLVRSCSSERLRGAKSWDQKGSRGRREVHCGWGAGLWISDSCG